MKEQEENTVHPNMEKYWKHRRTHSYISLGWVMFSTLMWAAMAIFYPASIPLLGGVIGWSYAIPFGVISWYFGNTMVDILAGKKTPW